MKSLDPVNVACCAVIAVFLFLIFPAGCTAERDLAKYRDNQESTAILRGHR